LVIDGKELIDQQKEKSPQIASDGIALGYQETVTLLFTSLTANTPTD